jgi:PTS system nitrogen regulatory IIA component
MKISDFLTESNVLVGVAANDKSALLRELAAKAADSLGVKADQIAGELLKREGLGSTGIGNGVAIPHARFQELKNPFGLFARLKRPIEFDAIDRQKVDLVFLLLLPDSKQENGQLTPLALVARKFRESQSLAELRNAGTRSDVYACMAL